MEKRAVKSMVKDEKLIETRRSQIIKSAVTLFKEKGFHRTTTREIAKEAGFSIGTLYEYIREKEDILYLVSDFIYDQFRVRMEEEASSNLKSLDLLHLVISSYFKLVDDKQDEMLVMYQEAKSLSKKSLPYVLKKELQLCAIFEKILTRCVEEGHFALSEKEIKAAAHNILVFGQMWAFRRWALRSIYTIEEYTNIQMEFIMKGISKNNK
ncbi:TetR family transcriptional regulator [Pueribacillus theae]|uniref:TetR family transcriptional regulator n=1 Tax=Pueribacillus theae TaxID=2171751 RepID=A0A2U1K316_9BACI|nr:TetR/AcrR family transcriptional regulator [Pueribacillus theae]PWA11906.1 TetR family transcriptional regulator [Pueribacillus theae]